MRNYIIIPTYIICFIWQLSIGNMLTINGIEPNYLLCLSTMIVFIYDKPYNAFVCALVGAMVLDIVSSRFFGMNLLVYALLLLGVLLYKEYLNNENKMAMIVLAVTVTVMYHVIMSIIMSCVGLPISLVRIIKFLPLAIVLNGIVMFLIYLFLRRKASVYKHTPRNRYERY